MLSIHSGEPGWYSNCGVRLETGRANISHGSSLVYWASHSLSDQPTAQGGYYGLGMGTQKRECYLDHPECPKERLDLFYFTGFLAHSIVVVVHLCISLHNLI